METTCNAVEFYQRQHAPIAWPLTWRAWQPGFEQTVPLQARCPKTLRVLWLRSALRNPREGRRVEGRPVRRAVVLLLAALLACEER